MFLSLYLLVFHSLLHPFILPSLLYCLILSLLVFSPFLFPLSSPSIHSLYIPYSSFIQFSVVHGFHLICTVDSETRVPVRRVLHRIPWQSFISPSFPSSSCITFSLFLRHSIYSLYSYFLVPFISLYYILFFIVLCEVFLFHHESEHIMKCGSFPVDFNR